jgi:hypothetical protein
MSQLQSSGCMTSAVAFSEKGLTLTREPLQSLVVQTTRHVVVRSLCSVEDAPSERSCSPVISIPEDPSASTQVTKKTRGHRGSPPHVISCQGTDTTFDMVVSWSLTGHWTQKTHQLLPRLPCPSLTRRRRLCMCVVPFVCDITPSSCRVTPSASPTSSPTSKFPRLIHHLPQQPS